MHPGIRVGRLENAIGWYHSHPGYGFWLSGIDTNKQLNNQKFTDPLVAVVIVPNRTISARRVDICAFCTYSRRLYAIQCIVIRVSPSARSRISAFTQINTILWRCRSSDAELFGLLWNKYRVNTLSQSPLTSAQTLYLFSTPEQEPKASFRILLMPPLGSPTCIKS
ncbi:hypothetical protein BJY52DRAFT_385485 [Lactarius psammicola]|nr:hypothetical protein BJY52DRAFT_385485 [Lactarius psammicola]